MSYKWSISIYIFFNAQDIMFAAELLRNTEEQLNQMAISNKNKFWIFAPHPDDEILGTGGLIAKYPEKFFVVCITDGGGSTSFSVKSDAEREELVRLRIEDDLVGLRLLGFNNYFFMNYPEVKSEKHRNSAKEIIKSLIKNGTPEKIFIPSPYESEKEVKTHRITTEIIVECIRELKNEGANPQLYGYEVWDEIPRGPRMIIEDISDLIDLIKAAMTAHKTEKNIDFIRLKEARAKIVAVTMENKPDRFGYGEKYLDMTDILKTDVSLDEYCRLRRPLGYSFSIGISMEGIAVHA